MHAQQSTQSCEDRFADDVRTTAFRVLLDTGEPVDTAVIAESMRADLAAVRATVEQLDGRGLVRRDDHGGVVGSFGLSVVPARDVIRVAGRRYWTWCAKTSLGVLGAIGRGGSVVSESPLSGKELRLAFDGARPTGGDGVAVFWPDAELRSSCSSVVDEFCSSISFFESAEAAREWARANQVGGEVLTLDEAADRAVGQWVPLVAGIRL